MVTAVTVRGVDLSDAAAIQSVYEPSDSAIGFTADGIDSP